MNANGITIVDGETVERVNGMDAFAKMDADFRDNLGDSARVEELLSKYNLRMLWRDEDTTRRIDHVVADPGYQDLSEAYHESVEEGYVIEGEIVLSAEGSHLAGDYFWRPPGWVHSAYSTGGFSMLLMMEGASEAEGSGRVSRVVRPDEEVGTHRPESGFDPVGPRGYVRLAEARHQPWNEEDLPTAGLEPGSYVHKILSRNEKAGSMTVVVRAREHTLSVLPSACERFFILVAGQMTLAGDDGASQTVRSCSLVRVAPEMEGKLDIDLSDDAEFLLKVVRPN